MQKWIGSGWLGLLVVLILATPGVARADWGDIWGEMLWGGLETPFVPALPPGFEWALALLLLAAALGARRARPRTAALLLTLALVPGLARAAMVVIPHKMVNGTVADAVEVNENFDALATAFNDFSGRFGLDPPDPEGSPVFSEGECANRVIGEVWMFAGPYPPEGTLFAHGQILSIVQYSSLFSLLSTRYGGDGRTLFGLPDLRGLEPEGINHVICLLGPFPASN